MITEKEITAALDIICNTASGEKRPVIAAFMAYFKKQEPSFDESAFAEKSWQHVTASPIV